jgi:hypothetical protein
MLLLIIPYKFLGAPATHYLHNLVDQNWTLNPHGVCFLVIQIIIKDIFVLNLRQVYISHHVKFNESQFPYRCMQKRDTHVSQLFKVRALPRLLKTMTEKTNVSTQ